MTVPLKLRSYQIAIITGLIISALCIDVFYSWIIFYQVQSQGYHLPQLFHNGEIYAPQDLMIPVILMVSGGLLALVMQISSVAYLVKISSYNNSRKICLALIIFAVGDLVTLALIAIFCPVYY